MRTAFIVWVIYCFGSLASQDHNYGLGGSSSGRVSSMVAEPRNPFAAVYNPALITAQTEALFSFSTSQVRVQHSQFSEVLVDHPEFPTERGIQQLNAFRPPDTEMTVWALGFALPFRSPIPLIRRLGIGVTASGPYNRLRTLIARTPYDFYSLRYGNSDSQLKTTLGISAEIIRDHLYLGGGLSLFLTSSGVADATLTSQNPTARMAMDIGLNTAPVVGILAKFEKTNIGLVYREEVNPIFQQTVVGKIRIAGSTSMQQPFILKSSLYFEPRSWELETQQAFGWCKISLGVSYQIWSRYQAAHLIVETTDSSGVAHSTSTPSPSLKDIFSPRLSFETPLFSDRFLISTGYQFRPSPVTDLSGPNNLLDSDTHILGLSFTHQIAGIEWLNAPFRWGFYGQYHQVASRTVTKTSGNFIGAPGYKYSANAYTYGLFLEASL